MIALLLDHLWQSSLFLGGAGLLTLAFRRNSANIRFWLWFAGSAKFLLPFAILAALGSYLLTPIAPPLAAPALIKMAPVAQPFSGPAPVVAMPNVAAAPAHLNLPFLLLAIWLLGVVVLSLRWLIRWRQLQILLRDAAPSHFTSPVAVKFSSSRLEPGLVGIIRPVILLPVGIEQQLTSAQMNAILAHELCHWRRRDNLLAAFHMLVEALFWFFPLVWWLGARLNAERERACDESVLASGNDPKTYAEGILKVCRAYLQSPLACAAGVSGAGLKRRMDIIMENRAIARLTRAGKTLLSGLGVAAFMLPVGLGLLTAPPASALAQVAAIASPVQTAELRAAPPSDESNNNPATPAQPPIPATKATPPAEPQAKQDSPFGTALAAAVQSQLAMDVQQLGNLWPARPVPPQPAIPQNVQVAAAAPVASNPVSPAQASNPDSCRSSSFRSVQFQGTVIGVHTDPQLFGTDIVIQNPDDHRTRVSTNGVLVALIPTANVREFPGLDDYVGRKVCITADRVDERDGTAARVYSVWEITNSRQLQVLSSAADYAGRTPVQVKASPAALAVSSPASASGVRPEIEQALDRAETLFKNHQPEAAGRIVDSVQAVPDLNRDEKHRMAVVRGFVTPYSDFAGARSVGSAGFPATYQPMDQSVTGSSPRSDSVQCGTCAVDDPRSRP